MMSQRNLADRDASRMMLIVVLSVLLVLVAISLRCTTAHAQTAAEPKLDRGQRAAIIDSVTATLNSDYVYPDVAKQMEKLVRQYLKQGKYDTLTDPIAFTMKLTEDLRSVSKDRHLGVRYFPDLATMFTPGDTLTDSAKVAEAERARLDNYGFYKVERLPGNIGYIDFRRFASADVAGPTAVAAMNFLGNVDAIIFDLRQNGGGDATMIQLLSSYLFGEQKHLNSFYFRPHDTIHQTWTLPYVPGRHMSNVDVYVLTSSFTFSGAEEFTYNLKNLKRATIIGETTGGGAHPVEDHAFLHMNIQLRVPFGRAINPVTNANWEGVGVKPDIEVPAAQALAVARIEALKKLRDRVTDPDRKRMLAWDLEGEEAEQHPVTVDPATMQKYAGTFGPRKILFENGALFYQREGRPKFKLVPLSTTVFRLDSPDTNYFRLKFVANERGEVTEVVGLYDDGREERSPRSGS